MTLKEAKEIVGNLVGYVMTSNGIKPPKPLNPIKEDLITLLRANKMVKAANARAQKRIDKIVKVKGRWSGKRIIPMTISDRDIASIYVAANFRGDDPKEPDPIAIYGSNMVLCINRYLLPDDEDNS